MGKYKQLSIEERSVIQAELTLGSAEQFTIPTAPVAKFSE